MGKILSFVKRHKIFSLIILVVLIVASYSSYKKINTKEGEISYVSQAVERGMLISSISGTGQVSASSQIDIKSESSGKVVYIGVENNQEVRAGQLVAQLDATDAMKAVRDAEINLTSAELSLEKLEEPASRLSILQAENNAIQAEEAKINAQGDLVEAYEEGFNDTADTFLDLPSIMSGLEDIFFEDSLNNSQWNLDYYVDSVDDYNDKIVTYRDDFYDSYQLAREKYDLSFDGYKEASRFSDAEIIEDLIEETYETVKYIAEAIKNGANLVDLHEDVMTQVGLTVKNGVNAHQSSLASYTNTTNGHLSGLLSAKNLIDSSEEDIVNSQRDIDEKKEILADLKAGSDTLDIQSQELSILQRKNSLLDAKQNLADYYIYAPSDGIITNLDLSIGQSITNSTMVADFISQQKIAEITLNEIDAAQVKVGQKVTLEFDAVEDLSITGEVVEIDELGAVTQGVVSYDIKIGFDVQDERIKPGMSVSASIILEAKQGVLLVPISAVKSQATSSYVEVLADSLPQKRMVTTGLSNDVMIEVVDGLEEGEQIIIQTINNGDASGVSSKNTQGGQSNSSMKSMYRIAH